MSRCVFLIFAFFCFASFVCVISVAILLSNTCSTLPLCFQGLRNLQSQGAFGAYDRTMDAILSRLQGKSDGSLPSDTKG